MRQRILTFAIVIFAALLFAAVDAQAERGDDTDRASKNGETVGTIDDVEITLEYGRPNVKNRTIWGGLVPYDTIWRTGANEATTIELSEDVLVDGNPLAAGRYALFTIPGEKEWTVIFNRQADQWGAFKYDAEQDALRVTAVPRQIDHVESLDFVIEDSTVLLRWEELAVPIAIAAD